MNAALVEVNSIDDAKLLIENASMTRLPIVVRIHNLDLLEYTSKFSGPLDRGFRLRLGSGGNEAYCRLLRREFYIK